MTTLYDYAVFIGRFQPFHIGHLFVFQEALKSAKHLIVLVGSADEARCLRNPFSFDERQAMIKQSLPNEITDRVTLLPLPDYLYDDEGWVKKVTELVEDEVKTDNTVALVGHDKDETTYYLKLFPNWAYIEVGNLDGISATPIRRQYLADSESIQNNEYLLAPTKKWLSVFATTPMFHHLQQEYQAVQQFKLEWSNTPYPVIFTTTDALVRYHDEILLITRKNYPGKDLLALPGGFLDEDETLFDGCLRELSEETHLNVDRKILKKSLIGSHIFDEPKRSDRGRLITHCYYFDISSLSEKPSAYADDDAKSLAWYNIADLRSHQFFDDHFFMINYFLKNIRKKY